MRIQHSEDEINQLSIYKTAYDEIHSCKCYYFYAFKKLKIYSFFFN